jgi:DNA topoisomerase I
LEEALELFKFPRVVGDLEGKPMVVKVGRFGPYVDHDGVFASVPKGEDPMEVTAERAEELILARRKAIAERTIKEFDEDPEVKILKGRWGPYIAIGKRNVRIPKGTEAASLTFAEVMKIADEQSSGTEKEPAAKAAKKAVAKKTPTKKTATKKKAAKKTAKKASKKAVKKSVKKAAKKTEE